MIDRLLAGDLLAEGQELTASGVETDNVWWPRWFAVADGRALNTAADDAL